MSTTLLRSLAEVVGPSHCLSGAERAPYVIDGRTPCGVVFPGSVEEVARVVREAAAVGVPVVPWGGGTQMHRGAPPGDGAVVVGLRRLGRVLEHEPGDLTATVEAGITVETLQVALGARGQWWPLDPPAPAEATLGGVLAANTAGPRRHGYGTARDLVIGLRVVAADGQLVRAGGKVVKNVAGYDLVKLYIGSLGTLGHHRRRDAQAPSLSGIGGGLLGLVSHARCCGPRGGGPRRLGARPRRPCAARSPGCRGMRRWRRSPACRSPGPFRRVRRACQRGRVGA